MTSELKKLDTWFTAKKLSINVSKTNYMVFVKGKRSLNAQSMTTRTINDIEMQQASSTKFLGVLVDDKLN